MEEEREEARWDEGRTERERRAPYICARWFSATVCIKHHVAVVPFPPLELTDGSVAGLLNSGPLKGHCHSAMFPKSYLSLQPVSRLPRKSIFCLFCSLSAQNTSIW